MWELWPPARGALLSKLVERCTPPRTHPASAPPPPSSAALQFLVGRNGSVHGRYEPHLNPLRLDPVIKWLLQRPYP